MAGTTDKNKDVVPPIDEELDDELETLEDDELELETESPEAEDEDVETSEKDVEATSLNENTAYIEAHGEPHPIRNRLPDGTPVYE